MAQAEQQQPTAADMQKMGAVAAAGGEAAENASTPAQAQADAAQAMKAERDRQRLVWLPDEQIDAIATQLSEKMIAGLDSRGAFDPPPEPVHPEPVAPPTPGEQAASNPPAGHGPPAPPPPAAGEPPPQAPRKSTFAERFMGS
jgi:hypothetical protein